MEAPSLELELFQSLAERRFTSRLRWGSVALLLSVLVPYEVVDGVPQFLWQVGPELDDASLLSALSLPFLGLALLVAARVGLRLGSLVFLVLLGLSSVVLLEHLGAEAAAWNFLTLPETAFQPGLVLLPSCLVGAGLPLASRGDTRRIGRWFLGGAALVALATYLVPVRDEMPMSGLVTLLSEFWNLPSFRFQLGVVLVLGMILLPLAVGAVGACFCISPPKRDHVILSQLLTYALPLALSLMIFRGFMLTFGNSSLTALMMSVPPLGATLALLTSALEVAGFRRFPTRRAAFWGVGTCLLLILCQISLALPPNKGTTWELSAPNVALDRLWGTQLDLWNDARGRWFAQKTRAGKAAATELVGLQRQARELLRSAKENGVKAESELRALTEESRHLDLAGRRWYRLIHEVNEANRKNRQPYYLDPDVEFSGSESGLERSFDVSGYRIESVSRFRVASASFATLHVRRLGEPRNNHNMLGFSRDMQPFALVVVDKVETMAQGLQGFGQADTPSCLGILEDDPALSACAERLRALAQQPTKLRDMVHAVTTRHELQHQIDGPSLYRPTMLRQHMRLHADWAEQKVNRELSAYLAEFAATGGCASLCLMELFGFAWQEAENAELRHVGMLALATLSDRHWDAGSSGFTRRELSSIYLELNRLSDEALTARAAHAWEQLYGEPLPRAELE